MNPVLLHIWGPLAIHAYGTCIALGVFIALILLNRNPKAQLFMTLHVTNIVPLTIISGYLGGRILYLLSEDIDASDVNLLTKFWEPGLSILGCIIGIAIALKCYSWYKKISVFSITDIVAIYSPLIQSFGRIGCFFSGCCFGQQTSAWWAVVYDHPDHMAPLNIALHPTQLYSSIILFGIFLIMYHLQKKPNLQAGFLTLTYLLLVSAERLVVDFWRWDRTWFAKNGVFSYLSTNQWVALGIIFVTIFVFFISSFIYRKNKHGSV